MLKSFVLFAAISMYLVEALSVNSPAVSSSSSTGKPAKHPKPSVNFCDKKGNNLLRCFIKSSALAIPYCSTALQIPTVTVTITSSNVV